MPKKKSNAGRPRIEIDIEKVKALCRVLCTQEEICHVFECDRLTLDRRLKEAGYANFEQFFKIHSAEGKASLRRSQYKAAMDGNAALLIWLGKQFLGQRDKTELSGPEDTTGKPQPLEIRFVEATPKD